MQLVDVYFFELRHFGLQKDFKALIIHLKISPVIVLEGDGAVIDGIKNPERFFPLTTKLTMTK